MQQFKVGDYVRVPEYNKCFKFKGTFEDEDGTIYIADGYDEIFGQQGWLETECELWQPKEGEWCWFKDEKNTIGSLTQLVGIEEDGTYYGYSSCGIPDKAPCVEPFIGELPTFLQH